MNSSVNGSGPSVARPGTSSGSRTTQIANDFLVPASVRSKPVSSSSTTRAAIVDFEDGFGGSAGTDASSGSSPLEQVGDQVQAAGADVEVLAVATYVVDEGAVERGERRIEGLEGSELGEMDRGDGVPVEASPEILGERLDLGKFRHASTLGADPRPQWRL